MRKARAPLGAQQAQQRHEPSGGMGRWARRPRTTAPLSNYAPTRAERDRRGGLRPRGAMRANQLQGARGPAPDNVPANVPEGQGATRRQGNNLHGL